MLTRPTYPLGFYVPQNNVFTFASFASPQFLTVRSVSFFLFTFYAGPVQLTVPGLKGIHPLLNYRPPCAHGPWFRLGHPNVECTVIAQWVRRSPSLTKFTAIPYFVARECIRR